MKFYHNMKRKISIFVVAILIGAMCWNVKAQTNEMNQVDTEEYSLNDVIEAVEEESTVVHVPSEERLAGENVSVDLIESLENEDATYSMQALRQEAMIADTVIPIEELYQETDVDSFFSDAIFVGDSLTVGLTNYYEQQKGNIFTDSTQFLARVGCSAKMALSNQALPTYAQFMPYYNGTLCRVEDGVAASGAKKVFIDYGLNDLVGCTPDEFFENMVTLINGIIEKSPDVQIYVIGTTYVVAGSEKASLTNENIHASNEKMKTYCQEVGWGYINIADYLADNNGTLQSIYSSDQYVHQNTQAYEIWVKVLRNYAKNQLDVTF